MTTVDLPAEIFLRVLEAVLLALSALGTFWFVSGRWEKRKLTIEVSQRMAEKYWIRLEVLAIYLGRNLMAELRTRPLHEKQEVFHRLLEFRLTLARFYEDVSGMYVGKGRPEVMDLIKSVMEKLSQILSAYEWSRGIHALESSDGRTKHLHETIDEMNQAGSILADLYQKFETWVGLSGGRDCADLGSMFDSYAEALNKMTRSTLTYIRP